MPGTKVTIRPEPKIIAADRVATSVRISTLERREWPRHRQPFPDAL
jgi:hypothetical protein